MSKNIPDLNYDSKLSIDDWAFKSNHDETQQLERTKVVFGDGSLSNPRYGVVDQMDPRNVVTSDTTRPLLVTASEVDPLRINVTAGKTVNPNGTLVELTADVIDFELERTNEDDVIVVFIENEIIEQNPTRVTKYGVGQKVRREQSEEKLRSALLSSYSNTSTFNSERKANLVVIAIVAVVSGSSGFELQIDMTANSYSFNRPWYSPVDVEHRSSLGSGVSTSQNIHGLAFNDLSSGNLPFYIQTAHTGLILATDRDIKGLPGTACEETITPARIQTDTVGTITAESRFGKPLAKYIRLGKIPTDLSNMHLTSNPSRSIAFDWVKGTNLVVLPDSEVFTQQATIRYNRVFALEAPEALVSNTITYEQPDELNELVISELSYDTITNPSLAFEGSGPVPRKFTVYLNTNGSLVSFPQIVQRTTLLTEVGSTFVPLVVNQFGPAPIAVGLADATPGSGLRVVVRIFGKDSNNVTITEDLVFNGSWISPVLPAQEDLNNLRKTKKVFDLITGYQIIERENDGSGSKIVIYAEVETGITNDLNRLAIINTVEWDGLSLGRVRDRRQIQPFLPGYDNRFSAAAMLQGVGGTEKSWILTEDVRFPKHRSVTAGFVDATAATYSINFSNDVQSGDTVELKPGIIVTAVVGVPNRNIGEFTIGGSEEDTRNDFVLTVNNPTFNSGLTAIADPNDATQANISHNTLGARGNLPVVVTTALPNAITKSSDPVNGYDAYGETFIPHHDDVIKTIVPNAGTYEVTNIRNRYLSKSIAINLKPVVYVIVHGAKPPFTNVQLRVRAALETFDYDVWEVITPVASGSIVYKIDKGQDISKIQIEMFGEFQGFSVYEATT